MRAHELLKDEIKDVKTHGDFDKESPRFDPQDRKLLTNPKALEKMIGKWGKFQIPVYINFVNQNLHKIKRPNVFDPHNLNVVGWWDANQLAEINKEYNLDIPYHPEGINIIFTHNTASNKQPMSNWIIAHRIGEISYWDSMGDWMTMCYASKAICQELFGKIAHETKLRPYYGLDYFIYPLLTMRSSRIKHPTVRVDYELELFAQYVVTGDIQFDVDALARAIEEDSKKNPSFHPLTPKNKEKIEQYTKRAKIELKNVFDAFINGLKGKIAVY